jgi:hypothetical protein
MQLIQLYGFNVKIFFRNLLSNNYKPPPPPWGGIRTNYFAAIQNNINIYVGLMRLEDLRGMELKLHALTPTLN